MGNTRGKPRDVGDYFTAMMLRRDTTSLERSDVQPFTSSVMMRTLLTVEVSEVDFDAGTLHQLLTIDFMFSLC